MARHNRDRSAPQHRTKRRHDRRKKRRQREAPVAPAAQRALAQAKRWARLAAELEQGNQTQAALTLPPQELAAQQVVLSAQQVVLEAQQVLMLVAQAAPAREAPFEARPAAAAQHLAAGQRRSWCKIRP